jgi:hypothetical protein
MPLKVNFDLLLEVTETTFRTTGQAEATDVVRHAIEMLTGTAAGQADLAYVADRTVAGGANDDIDLAGILPRPLGGVLTAAEVVMIIIINKPSSGPANTTNLTLGGGTNPVVGYLGGTTPTIGPIRPNGGRVLFETDVAGLAAVVAGTGDILRVANSAGAAATYQIAIIARSA